MGNGQSSGSRRPPRNQVDHDRTTEVDEARFEQHQASKPRPGPTGSAKRKIAIVVREEALGLLWNLPTPLNLANTDVFVLVHSPKSGGNPEKVYKVAKDVFPRDYPREYIMPYMIEEALMPLLRHLAPEAVYLDESLVGEGGSTVAGLLDGNWVGAVVVATADQGKGKGAIDGWQQGMQKYGRRCTVIARSGIRSDWAGRVG